MAYNTNGTTTMVCRMASKYGSMKEDRTMNNIPCRNCCWRMTNIRGRSAEKNKGKSRPALCNHPAITPNTSDKQQFLPMCYYRYCQGKGFKAKK